MPACRVARKMMKVQNLETKLKHLEDLSKRLNARGFSWQHDDYFVLQELLPLLLESNRKIMKLNSRKPGKEAGGLAK